jgi:uncharacterized damage-inducible protein DinB
LGRLVSRPGFWAREKPACGETEPRRVAGIRTHNYLKARLLSVRQDFDAELDKLTDSDLPRRPADDMPSIAGLLVEIANKEKELIAWLQDGEWPDDDPDAFKETATLAEMRSVFATLREQTLRYIDSFDEAGLEELVACPEKWWEALRLEACPRSEILRNLAAHEWYHTGQLIVYMHTPSKS